MPERRYNDQRRWGIESEYPLRDSSGVMVTTNRRHMPDRRLDNISMAERLTLFSEMPPLDPDR